MGYNALPRIIQVQAALRLIQLSLAQRIGMPHKEPWYKKLFPNILYGISRHGKGIQFFHTHDWLEIHNFITLEPQIFHLGHAFKRADINYLVVSKLQVIHFLHSFKRRNILNLVVRCPKGLKPFHAF